MTTFIDAHHHLWAPQSDPDDLGYVWLRDIGAMKPFGDPTPIQRDYLLDEFIAEPDRYQMIGSVHVQCDPKLPDPVKETAFIQRISDQTEHPVMIVGFADLAASTFAQVLSGHLAHANLRGIRQIISHLPDRPDISFAAVNLLDDPTWRENFKRLGDHGLSFDLQLYPEQMQQAADFLSKHPEVPVVIDHLGSPYGLTDDGIARWDAPTALWHDGLKALASLPNVSIKFGGTAMYFGDALGSVQAFAIRDTLALFGADRVMFASNFPVDKLHLTYPDLLRFVVAEVGVDAQASVLQDNAAAFYRFPSTAC